MFMEGCSPELEGKYQRIQARGIVMRNLFALSGDVQKTIYWYLPESHATGADRFNMMNLMYGKLAGLNCVMEFSRRTIREQTRSRG